MNQLLKIALSLLSAAAYFLTAFSPIFLWIAPLPLLVIAFRENKITNYVIFFLAYLIGNFLQGVYVYSGTPFPLFSAFIPLVIESTVFSGILWLTRTLAEKINRWYSCFIFPVFWTAYLFLSSYWGIESLPIFSQVEWPVMIQIVSVTGLFGLVFLTALFPSGIAIFFRYRNKSLAITLLIVALNLLFGFVRMQTAEGPRVKVGMAAKNPPDIKTFLAPQDDPIGKAQELSKAIRELAGKGAEYILFPEQALWVTSQNQTEIFQIISTAAKENNVHVLAPMSLAERSPARNALVVFDPKGKLIAEYFKMHPVAGFESVAPGEKLAYIYAANRLAGLAICHDMDFFQPTREYSKEGVGMLFVPAADFGTRADGTWHAQVAILQSVAGGFSLARAAYFGILSGTDAYGRVIAWEQTRTDQQVLALADLPMGPGQTFYAETGNWFAWICCLCAAGLIFLLFL